MSEIRKDELIGKEGNANPLLYAACGLAWLNLGDLVHDTEDPQVMRTFDNMAPKVNEFHVLTDRKYYYDSGRNTTENVILSSALWMASWVRQPKNGESGITLERRYSMTVIDDFEVKIENKKIQKSQNCTELIIGRRSVVMTQLINTPESNTINQTYEIPYDISERFRLMIAVPKVLKSIKPVLDEKREAKQKFRDSARALQDVDHIKDLEFDEQGTAYYDGVPLVAIVDKIRQQADTSNNRKLTQIWGGRSLLFDRYNYAKNMTSFLINLSGLGIKQSDAIDKT
jgi:hypothetical protein